MTCQEIKTAIADLREESANMGYVKPLFLISDDDDAYQDALEVEYEQSRISSIIEELEEQLVDQYDNGQDDEKL